MTLAIDQTVFLAVKYYEDSHIAAACVAFLEMLNEDTQLLRLLVNTACMLHKGQQVLDRQADSRTVHQRVGEYL